MHKLILTLNAVGYKGDDYEEEEIHQEKHITKNSTSDAITEADCGTLIQEMIQSVKEMKQHFLDQEDPLSNKLVSVNFLIADTSDETVTYDEKRFFNIAATYDSLTDVILEYLNVTDHGDEGTRIWLPEDDQYESHPAGTFAALALVEQDKKWISNYIAFLRTNDLDHEMMQMWQIKSIIEKYGWCEETSKLAIARVVSCCGQSGREQFSAFVQAGLKAYVTESKNRNAFFQNILKEFEEWDKLEFRLKDGSEKHYIKYVVSYAKHFDALLTKDEIEEIEMYLLKKWRDYNATSE